MIQETEMKQRPARMVGLIKSFQTMISALKQDVSVLFLTFQPKLGEWTS